MDHPDEPVRPPVPEDGEHPDLGDPEAVRAYVIAAFIIVAGMILWAFAMIGY